MIYKILGFVILLAVFTLSSSFVIADPMDENSDLENMLNTRINRSSLYNQKISEIPNSVIIISHEDIKLYGYQTVAELVGTLQGIYTRNDLNYEAIGSRGFDRPSSFSNNMILINGHVLNELVYGSQSLDNYLGIDMFDISRIEIVQGPSSTLYGSGAMVTLINIILKDAKELNNLTAGITYGTYNMRNSHISIANTIDDFSFVVTGRYGNRDGKDFTFPEFSDSISNGRAENMDWEKFYGATLQAKYKELYFNFYYSNREKSIPNAPYQSDFNTAPTKSKDIRSYMSLMYNNQISDNKFLKAKIFFDTYNYDDVFQYDNVPLYDENEGLWGGTEIDFTWDISPQNRLLAGTNITRVSKLTSILFDSDSTYFANDIPFTSASFFIQNSYQLYQDFSINFGVRADFLSYYKPNFNPRVALIYNTSEKSTLKYLINAGYRTPSIYELFTDDPTFKQETSNLRPESILSNELIWDNYLDNNIFYTFSIYYNRFSNIIDLAAKNSSDDDSDFLYKNFPYFNSYGAELAFRSSQNWDLNWYANFSYQLTTDSSGKEVSNSPQFLFKAGASYKLVENLFISLESKYESRRKTQSDLYSEGFSLIDANIYFDPIVNKSSPFSFINNIEFAFRVKNLLDKVYYLPGPKWVSTNLIEQYGRIINLTIRAKI